MQELLIASASGLVEKPEEVTATVDEPNEEGVVVPQPRYAITNLNGKAAFATGLNLQFNCMGVFTVQANLGYAIPSEG